MDPEPLELGVEAEPLLEAFPEEPPPPPRSAAPRPPGRNRGFEAPAFAQIVFAAEAAVHAGIEEDLLIQADPIDLEVIGDEPLSFGAAAAQADDELPPPEPEDAPLEPPEAAEAPAELEILVEAESPAEAGPRARSSRAARRRRAPSRPAPPPARRRRPPVPRLRRSRPAAKPPPHARPPPPAPAPGLPRVPIFSDLGREAFLALTQGMVLHRVAAGEPVIREGEERDELLRRRGRKAPRLEARRGRRDVLLARLGEGDFFGEMALLSGAARSATVAAEEASEVLEFRADVLLEIAGHHPHVAQSLRRFYRQRLLANALAVSPIFRPFQRGERKLIMDRFRAREVAEGDAVIREGDPSDGLYVVLEGAVDVVKQKDGQPLVVGHLREGDLFGEMSCLRKAPASASIVVRRPGTLLRLPRKDFDDLVVELPADPRARLDAVRGARGEPRRDPLRPRRVDGRRARPHLTTGRARSREHAPRGAFAASAFDLHVRLRTH